jgi:iron complex transport system ATP-binding protein
VALTVLSVVDVSFSYPGRKVLEGIGFTVRGGELAVVLGPNGSGKTTLLRIIAGLLRPHSGTVLLDRASVHGMSVAERAKRIAYVPSELPLRGLGQLVAEFVAASRYLHYRGLMLGPRGEDLEYARKLLDMLEVGHLADKPLYTTSSGELQRALIAHGLARNAEVMVIDEPTSHQDMYGKLLIYHVLKRVAREGKAVIVATHDMILASLYADRVIVLFNGTKALEGDPERVLTGEVLAKVYGVEVVFASFDGRTIPIPLRPARRG